MPHSAHQIGTSRVATSRRQALAAIIGGAVTAASGCANHGLFGYTTRPNYDPDIRTVYVPIFKTRVLETTPVRGIEFELTREVVNAIESGTPFKVVSDPDRADTELQGTVVTVNKLILNRTPFNGNREVELILTVEIVWHDFRAGHEGRILTNPKNKSDSVPGALLPFDPDNPPLPRKPDTPAPVVITATGRALVELGETSTSAQSMAIKKVATKIISAMEEAW